MTLKNWKTALMFIPLVVAFIILIFVVSDLKHPVVQHDTCTLVGRGVAVQKFKSTAKLLYSQGGKELDDIGLNCKTFGNVYFNDHLPLPVETGETVKLTIKHYHYLSTRYNLSVPVVNPDNGKN